MQTKPPAAGGASSPEEMHKRIEAMKLAYSDVHRYVADPRTYDSPVAQLLSKEYTMKRAALIDWNLSLIHIYWTLRFLAITLAVSPLRRLLGLPDLIRFRRMLGLFAFFYGCLHFTTYLWLDKFFNFDEIAKDVWKRPFITAGFLGFISMAPLALTSTAGWIRRLGGRRWQMLHRLIYISAIAGVVHYYWLVKSDVRKPLLYGAIVFVLLAERAVRWGVGQRRARPSRERAQSIAN